MATQAQLVGESISSESRRALALRVAFEDEQTPEGLGRAPPPDTEIQPDMHSVPGMLFTFVAATCLSYNCLSSNEKREEHKSTSTARERIAYDEVAEYWGISACAPIKSCKMICKQSVPLTCPPADAREEPKRSYSLKQLGYLRACFDAWREYAVLQTTGDIHPPRSSSEAGEKSSLSALQSP